MAENRVGRFPQPLTSDNTIPLRGSHQLLLSSPRREEKRRECSLLPFYNAIAEQDWRTSPCSNVKIVHVNRC